MKAFIYSLDAFISLMIIAMAMNMLIFGLGLSTYQYTVAYQLKLLSSDGIKALAMSPAYLSDIVSGNGAEEACEKVIRKNLPPGYGYALLAYDGTNAAEPWANIAKCSSGNYTKAGIGVQSSDAIVTASTVTALGAGGRFDDYYNPFGYKTCSGLEVPCNLQEYMPEWGVDTTLMRLVVFI
jgi:hypothetical protein